MIEEMLTGVMMRLAEKTNRITDRYEAENALTAQYREGVAMAFGEVVKRLDSIIDLLSRINEKP